ncbi:MAG: four helix bundle protein [Candidatus Magasanikbacteria bacterium]|nr:four helix bundle protein [Candidatus Magasanikbacteria bacterium]
MTKISKNEGVHFTKIDIWQRSFNFAIKIIQLCDTLPNNQKTWILTRQIIRSSTSISANLAEGSGGSTKKEFIRYADISRKSALETYNWLLFIEKIFKLSEINSEIKKENVEIIKILSKIVINSKKS